MNTRTWHKSGGLQVVWVLCALVLLVAAGCMHPARKTNMVPVVEHDGRAYVAASALAPVGIAIKPLPGQDEFVVCSRTRCALVKGAIREQGEILAPVSALSEALGLTVRFDANRARVSFVFGEEVASAKKPGNRVGQVAPDFRLSKLDGSAVALSDFAGKRVLINSWASW